jgi:hypothetical protein
MGTPTNPLPPSDNPTGQTAPNEAGPSVDASLANLRLAESVDKLVAEMKNLLEFQKEIAEDSAEAFKATADSVEELVNKTGTVRDRLKSLVDYSKQFGRNMGKQTFAEATATVQKMRSETESLLKNSKANSQEQRVLLRLQRQFLDDEEKLNRHKADGNKLLKTDVALMKELAGTSHNVHDNVLKFTNALSTVNTGKLNKAFISISEVLGKGGGRVSDLKRVAQNAHEIKMARKEKTGDNKREYAKRKQEVEDKLRASGLDVFNARGEVDQEKFNKSKQARRVAVDTLTAGPNGETAGWLDRKLTEKAITGGGGLAGRLLGHTEAGGGSALEGLIGGGEGMLATGMTKFAGPVGIGLAVADAAKDRVNAIAKQNQELEKDLGKGGLFTAPGVGGAEAMGNARNNLRAWGWNAHNITTERQMAVAQSMQEEGAGLSELARPSGLNILGGGNARSVGTVGDIVMKQAREVGLTDVEGTKQVMKMLTNYKMTLQGTQDFFRTIGKDIHAAGISTTKYLQLIDDVTDHFGSMGKSIGAVTGLLRLLGATGTATYDQIKENTEALTDNKANLEQRSFLYAMQSPAEKESFAQAQESNAKNALEAFQNGLQKAMSTTGVSKQAVPALTANMTPDQMQKALSQFRMAMPDTADANAVTIPLEGYIKQAQAASINAQAARAGNPVGMAAISDITGKNEMGQVALQLQSFNQIMKAGGVSFGTGISSPTHAINANNAAVQSGLAGALNFDPDRMLSIVNGVSDATDKTYRMLKEGLHPGTFNNAQEEENFYAEALRRGGGPVGAGLTAKQTIQNMNSDQLSELAEKAKSTGDVSDALKLLTDTNNPFNRSLLATNQKTLAEQEGLTAGQATATRTLDSLFSELNSNILAWLGKPLGLLVDKWVGPSNVKGDTHTAQVSALQDKTLNANLDAAQKLEAAAEAKGTEWTDVIPDKDKNTRSLKELLATQEKLAKQVNEGGDVSKSTHDQLQTVNEDIRDIVSHATGGGFAGMGPASQAYWKKLEADKLGKIGVTEDMILGVKPPDTTHPAATEAAKGVKTDDSQKPAPAAPVVIKTGDIHNYGSATSTQPNTGVKQSSQETVKHVAAPPIPTTPPTPTQAQTGR